LEMGFPSQEFMDVIGVVYPMYVLVARWSKGKIWITSKSFYITPWKVGRIKLWILPLLDVATLYLHKSTFVLSMKNNGRDTLAPPHLVNLLIRLWRIDY
jgi:hypothetical protein